MSIHDEHHDRDDSRVIAFRDWCASKNISEPTGRRLIRSGRGPRVVQLSPRRIGITVRDDREWTEARIRDGAAQASDAD
jgi:predicted DNA-binding transcriptional regulator AlpA